MSVSVVNPQVGVLRSEVMSQTRRGFAVRNAGPS